MGGGRAGRRFRVVVGRERWYRRRPDHDGGYHLLFSHPRLLADLLAGFITEPWVAGLDLGSLRRVNAKLHGANLLRSDGDTVWRVRLTSGGHAFIYVILEFQSTPDPWMAIRMAAAVLLFYLHLIREETRRLRKPATTGGRNARLRKKPSMLQNGLLPPIYPLVLYNGRADWTPKLDTSELIAELPGLGPWSWRPSARYHVLAERRVSKDQLAIPDNITAVLFALEQCTSLDEVRRQVDRLGALLQDPEAASLRRAFTTWLTTVLSRSHQLAIGEAEIRSLSESKAMQDVVEAIDRDIQAAVLAALSEGEARGEARGEVIGEARGEARGEVIGEARGRADGRREVFLRLLRRRFPGLPSRFDAVIRTGGITELDEWTDRLLDARTLEDVFGDDRLQ